MTAFHICLKQYMRVKYLSVSYQCSPVGTFAPENDKVIYGLTHPINTFDILSVEVCYVSLKYIFIDIIFEFMPCFLWATRVLAQRIRAECQSAMLNVNMSWEFSAAFALLTFPHQWKSHIITITLVVHFKQERWDCRQETMCKLPLIIFSALSVGHERQTQSYLWHETLRHWIQCQK